MFGEGCIFVCELLSADDVCMCRIAGECQKQTDNEAGFFMVMFASFVIKNKIRIARSLLLVQLVWHLST